MTTPNGTAASIGPRVEGVVSASNEKGVKLTGQLDWTNFSKYADPPIAPPARGQRVSLAVDASGFVRSCEVLDTPSASSSSASPTVGDREMRRELRRASAIRIAAELVGQFAQTHEEVRVDHVFALAERVLRWIEQPEKGGNEPL